MVTSAKKRKKHLELLRREKVPVRESDLSNTKHFISILLRFALAGAGVVLFIVFAIPYFMDISMGVDPSLRYMPKVETEFNISESVPATGAANILESTEVACEAYSVKNDPYMDGNTIIFSTDTDKTNGLFLNTVVLYDTQSGTATELPGVERKYDNILETKLSGKTAVWVDCMVNGGGRICGYDLASGSQFVIKEFAYAIPEISISGDYIAFMQVAGEDAQRLYLYNLKTRENVTVKKYSGGEQRCGNVDIAGDQMVWSEYGMGNKAYVQRLKLAQTGAQYENPDFGELAFDPKTNGNDIVFCTDSNYSKGDLMLSVDGGEAVKIAQGVISYDIGQDYVVYMKDEKVFVAAIDNAQETEELTSDAIRGMLASVNGDNVCFYDTTDLVGIVEVVRYVDLGVKNGDQTEN